MNAEQFDQIFNEDIDLTAYLDFSKKRRGASTHHLRSLQVCWWAEVHPTLAILVLNDVFERLQTAKN